MEKKTVLNKKSILSILILFFCIAGGTLFYLNSDARHYSQATQMMEEQLYEEALLILEKFPDYKDAQNLIQEANYQIAYEAYKKEDYAKAVEYFEKAGDYKYSANFMNTSWYKLGHEAFLKKEYDYADECFSKIDNILDYGSYHFSTYDAAKDYILQEL